MLTLTQVRDAMVEVMDGEGPQEDRTYMTMAVPSHRTSIFHRDALISVPVDMYRELLSFIKLVEKLFSLPGHFRLFPTQDSESINTSTVKNVMINRSYRNSGAQDKFPQRFTITSTR